MNTENYCILLIIYIVLLDEYNCVMIVVALVLFRLELCSVMVHKLYFIFSMWLLLC